MSRTHDINGTATAGNGAAPSRSAIMKILVRAWEYRHPRPWAGVRFAAAIWTVVLGGILCADGFWWGALLMAVAALRFWSASRLLSSAQSGTAAGQQPGANPST